MKCVKAREDDFSMYVMTIALVELIIEQIVLYVLIGGVLSCER